MNRRFDAEAIGRTVVGVFDGDAQAIATASVLAAVGIGLLAIFWIRHRREIRNIERGTTRAEVGNDADGR